MKHLILFILLIGIVKTANAQADRIPLIDKKVEEIDRDPSLRMIVVDAKKVHNLTFDGGGTIQLYFNDEGLQKIHQSVGVSYGRLTTIIYLDKGKPLKIIDRDEDFVWREEENAWDYSELKQVNQAEVYVLNNQGEDSIIVQGKRMAAEGLCSPSDYGELIVSRVNSYLMKAYKKVYRRLEIAERD